MLVIKNFIYKYLVSLSLPQLSLIDIMEMLIIAFAIYQIIMWVKNTRAWMLVKGLTFLLIFSLVAIILQMNVILWIFKNAISVGIIAIIIVFQPELRSALEQLGRKKVFRGMPSFSDNQENKLFTDKTINALTKACIEMSKVKTGALIVIERDIKVQER